MAIRALRLGLSVCEGCVYSCANGVIIREIAYSYADAQFAVIGLYDLCDLWVVGSVGRGWRDLWAVDRP